MKQIWKDFKRELILAAIGIPLVVAALIWVAHDKPADPIRLTPPDPGEGVIAWIRWRLGEPRY